MIPAADRVLSSAELRRATVEDGAGWQAVRSVVTDPLHRGGSAVRATMLGGLAGPVLQVVRSKYKPGRKLSAYYRAGSPGGATAHLAVSWYPDGRVTVLRCPEDPQMPQLARLSDASALAVLVETFQEKPVAGPAPVVHVVRYQPGQRHVLLARSSVWPPVYAKTDRDDRGAHAVPVAQLIATALARQCPEALVADSLGHAARLRTSLWWQARGQPAAAVFARGRSAAPIARLVGRAARAIHDGCPGAAALPLESVPFHGDVRAEAAATLHAGEHISALLPSVGRTYRRLGAAVLDELEQLPGQQPTLVHGDLKSDNLLVDRRRLRLLDFDRAGRAEPAHDLAKFLADLRWWSPPADVAALEAAFRAGYGPCDPMRWQRAELLASLLQLKLAARRAALHDHRWPLLVRDRTDRAVQSFARARGR